MEILFGSMGSKMGIFTKSEQFDDDPIAKRVLAAFILLAVEVIVVAAMIPRSFTDSQINKELNQITVVMGEHYSQKTQDRARVWFNDYFVETGIYDETFRFFIPTEEQRRKSRGLEDFGQDNIFPFVEKTLVSIWTGLLQSTLRVSHYILWWPFLLLSLIPAGIDAYYERRIKQTSFRHSSPIRYRYAINSFMLIVMLFLFSVFFPLAVPPILVPIGFCIMAMSISFIFSNLQKKM
jgi:hypothetical protein